MYNWTKRKSVAQGIVCALIIMLFSIAAYAQTIDDSILKDFRWRNIGPANMGGRVVDIEAVESNPKIVYAGVATGGVWKTVNHGITWEPIFDDQPVGTVGDLAVSVKNPDIVYVGTGEANGRNSSPWGGGVYKSTDAGETWEFAGLKETYHIGRIIIDPKDPDIVYIAAVGHLWGHNEERGIYKTTDGGKTWNKIKYIDEKTGFIDLAMDPVDNTILYAASYERMRDGFSGGNPFVRFGPEAGIWVSHDAGKTWTKAAEGLPTTEMGRIGLAAARNKPGTLYAQIETSRILTSRNLTAEQQSELRNYPEDQRLLKTKEFLDEIASQQEKESGGIIVGGIYKSADYGKSWKRVGYEDNRPFYYSQIRVDPNDENVLWTCGVSLMYSENGGATFTNRTGTTHVDHHAIWIDPNDSDHVITGCDGGINITFDRGENWDVVTQMPLAQFYAITADMRKPYYVYGGLQDNGTWGGPSQTRSRYGIRNYHWFVTGGGDGFFAQVDPSNPDIVYDESQNGNLRRLDLKTGQSGSIRPGTNNIVNLAKYYPNLIRQQQEQQREAQQRGRGRSPFRFDWNSPILISPHNPTTVFFGGNHLFKTVDRGDRWSIISPDLTSTPDKASAIVSIDESPITPGVIWAGTNDGNVWLTRDGGVTWVKLNNYIPGAPEKYWVKRLEASNHVVGRAYLVYDGHRNDDQNPYVFVTEDFGQTWKKISNNLPEGSVFVVREDYKNPDLLFAGTSNTVYVSLDRGSNWTRFMNNMPTVEVHDLYIHPRDGDLIAGTHGRGAWIADNITPLQQLKEVDESDNAHLFEVRPATQWASMYEWGFITQKTFRGENPPTGSQIFYNLKNPATGNVTIEIVDVTGRAIRAIEGSSDAGIHRVLWNFREDPPPEEQQQQAQRMGAGRGGRTASPGEYLVRLSVDGKVLTTKLIVEKDTPDNMMIK